MKTLKEIREVIKAAKQPEWFLKTFKIHFSSPFNDGVEIVGFESVYKFTVDQLDGYSHFETLPEILELSRAKFVTLVESLDQYLIQNKGHDPVSLENTRNALQTRINRDPNNYKTGFILPNSAEVKLLIDVFQKYSNGGVIAAFCLLTGQKINAIHEPGVIQSVLLAYEFQLAGNLDLAKRASKERASVDKVRVRFQEMIDEGRQELNEYYQQIESNQIELIQRYETVIDSKKSGFEQMYNAKESDFDKWFNESKGNYDQFVSVVKHQKELDEKTYRELLSLKEPARYWEERGAKLRSNGMKSLYALISLIVIGIGLLFTILWIAPEDMFKSFVTEPVKAIRWSVVFIAFLSLLAYGIKILAKVSFSNFHLAADADERKMLTYLYLSLKHDGNVEESDRTLILQSLFSRADTGLLKDDSGPTMPTGSTLMDKAMGK